MYLLGYRELPKSRECNEQIRQLSEEHKERYTGRRDISHEGTSGNTTCILNLGFYQPEIW